MGERIKCKVKGGDLRLMFDNNRTPHSKTKIWDKWSLEASAMLSTRQFTRRDRTSVSWNSAHLNIANRGFISINVTPQRINVQVCLWSSQLINKPEKHACANVFVTCEFGFGIMSTETKFNKECGFELQHFPLERAFFIFWVRRSVATALLRSGYYISLLAIRQIGPAHKLHRVWLRSTKRSTLRRFGPMQLRGF